MTGQTPVLEVDSLKKYFNQSTNFISELLGSGKEDIQAVDDVSFSVSENETMGIIGESGCGKTTLLKTLIGLHEPTDGEIRFRDESVSEFSRGDWKQFRSNVQIIFQDPFNSLDPKLTVRETLMEPLKIHGFDNKDDRIRDILSQVELNPPEKFLDRIPEQLSGGEKQRVSIARALIVEPDLILADEPVSMLDVSTQASILRLLSNLTSKFDVAMLYISHDISTVSYVCETINVMYLGRIVETGPTETLIEDPEHPYSQALIQAVPIPNPHNDRKRTEMEGAAGDPIGLGQGCRFRDRCPERMEICEQKPAFVPVDEDRHVACHLYYDHDQYVDVEKSLEAEQ